MNPLLIRNAHLLDPEGGYDGPGAVRVRDGLVFEVLRSAQADSAGAEEVVDARGAALAPGLIDLRARGTPDGVSRLAAAAGVSTAVLASDPSAPADGPARVAALAAPGRAGARILPAAAATQAMEGERLAEIGLLHEAGAVLISDGDRAIGDSRVLRRVLRYAAGFGVPVAHRPIDVHLSRGAVAAEGEFAARLGLSGVPDVAERIGLERDVAIAEGTGAPLHLDGLSTAVGVAALAAAKARGAPVTGAVAIAHLLFNEVDMGGLDTRFRLDSPLRPESDRRALLDALADGTVDVVVSGHLPVPPERKHVPFAEADPGGATLHAFLPALLSLHHAEGLPLLDLLRAVTLHPARLLGLPSGRLQPGAPADLVLFDPNAPVIMDALGSPFDGRRLQGRVLSTWVGGRRVYEAAGPPAR
ncbi:MAG: amidohydrolase family protein [Proteobacteria bacterium]|nr:amidohydrolase family protein [Pseudomonadota bacterium]